MTPLMVRVIAGLEDARLLDHLTALENIEKGPGNGLSPGEIILKGVILGRLDLITAPEE